MLRWIVAGLACAFALAMLVATAFDRASWLAALMAAVFAAACVFERVRYRPIDPACPALPWEATLERFVDPESGRLVQVWQLPATGERCYVDAGPPAAPLA